MLILVAHLPVSSPPGHLVELGVNVLLLRQPGLGAIKPKPLCIPFSAWGITLVPLLASLLSPPPSLA
eukprot:4840142-Prorocentrum_lima.AAC.1